MSTIPGYPGVWPTYPVVNINGSDLIPLWSQRNGDTRKLSISNLLAFFQQQFASPLFSTQFAVPTTGFNLAVTDNGNNAWVLLQPATTLATGAITLPLASGAADGQEVLLTTTQAITAFSVSANGASFVNGAPSTLAANGYFTLRFNRSLNSWYRVG